MSENDTVHWTLHKWDLLKYIEVHTSHPLLSHRSAKRLPTMRKYSLNRGTKDVASRRRCEGKGAQKERRHREAEDRDKRGTQVPIRYKRKLRVGISRHERNACEADDTRGHQGRRSQSLCGGQKCCTPIRDSRMDRFRLRRSGKGVGHSRSGPAKPEQ